MRVEPAGTRALFVFSELYLGMMACYAEIGCRSESPSGRPDVLRDSARG